MYGRDFEVDRVVVNDQNPCRLGLFDGRRGRIGKAWALIVVTGELVVFLAPWETRCFDGKSGQSKSL